MTRGTTPYEGALVDLDGTVYVGKTLIPGADAGIRTLRTREIPLLFLSNKPIERRSTYAEKLTRLGIPTAIEQVINSSSITAQYLSETYPEARVFVVGEAPLRNELRESGQKVTRDPAEADVLLASMDRAFDYDTLTAAMRAADSATKFFATNPDRTCPTEDGEIPDCGAIIGAIEGATGTELDHVLGKPSQTTIDAAAQTIGADPDQCLMIGDRLETDVQMGNQAGMTTVLVLSGVTNRSMIAETDIQPDHVIASLNDLETVLSANKSNN